MPTSEKLKKQPEFFYWENGQRADGEIHNAILAEGDDAEAKRVSREIAKELGLSDEDCDALYGESDIET
jgi:hypothetical protein